MLLALLVLALSGFSQSATSPVIGHWASYHGRIGLKDITLSLYISQNGAAKGDYAEGDNCSHAGGLKGQWKDGALSLTAYDHDSVTGYLKGTLAVTDSAAVYAGNWRDAVSAQQQPFRVARAAHNSASSEQPYADYGILGTREEIEGFIRDFKDAVISGDKQWVAKHTIYPNAAVIAGRQIQIKNKEEMVRVFDQVFTADYKKRLSIWCVNADHIFANGHGINFELIWIKNSFELHPDTP